jgi:catechol 2,3-dioxygenase-like lactoylglutathione lyase family enzyme
LRPELDSIVLGDPPHLWERLGFTVSGNEIALGGIRLSLGADGDGIVGWSFRNLENRDLDGLGACPSSTPPPAETEHDNTAQAVDHVVALTPDFDRTVKKFREAGLDFRRIREAGNGARQAFFVLGPCLLELGGPVDGDAVRFWGLTIVVDDLDAAARRLGDRLGRIKDAVQPGRRIATLRPEAGLGLPVAFMSPRL